MKKLFETKALISMIILAFILAGNVNSQDVKKESPFSSKVDLMSRYVWRGTDFGGSPSIQPTLAFEKNNFFVNAWGAYAVNLPGVQEADLNVGYKIKKILTLTFTDYFFPNELTDNDGYFKYKQGETGHIFEFSVMYNGTEKLPLTVLLASNLYGADVVKNDENGLPTDDIMHSTYLEVGYKFKNIQLFGGFNVIAPDLDRGESGLYGDYLGFVNIGLKHEKEIKITDSFSVPFNLSLITNPQSEKIFMVAGISF
ncbi:MAG: hypothetical protein A2W91_10225 [Bacteroidetes bacterium GWF2_38_335]|nr:MAG: hypothetical protein A2W91_10225 [Bacteroidetes bacterium GWF2_38_335]HBS87999.1 hypothetical protein [Bacteroidales bacterium]